MAGNKNDPKNRTGVKQAPKTVLLVTHGADGKMYKRFVHDAALYAEIDGRLAVAAGQKRR